MNGRLHLPISILTSVSTRLLALILLTVAIAAGARAQTSSFTYQGRLTDGGTPATGTYDMQFKLYDMATVGTGALEGSPNTITNATVQVSSGVFTVQLDFGATGFPGADRFLEINVRHPGDPSYTTLSPREQITSTPYALRSSSAALADTATTATTATTANTATTADTATTATNATQLGGVAAGQYVQTNDSRLSDSRPPASGSSNYVQNGTSPQAGSNFNISGSGTAGGTLSGNVVNSVTQYNIGGSSALSVSGVAPFANTNTFVGITAGASNTPDGGGLGSTNSFYGHAAGFSNTQGSNNSFFGDSSGNHNTTGPNNSFFGAAAGFFNTTGIGNSFFGVGAGFHNTIGNGNNFFGGNAGSANTTGNANNFFGGTAGQANTTGGNNNFFGSSAGAANTTGNSNSFFGDGTGKTNLTGINNSFFGSSAGLFNTIGSINSFFGQDAGSANTIGSSNSFFGNNTGVNNTTGAGNTFIGVNTGNPNTATQVSLSTAIGFGATVSTSNTIVLGTNTETTQIPGNLNVTGTLTGTAINATQLGGVAANQYVQTGDARLTDARTPTAGSSNYVQNGTNAQAGSNFNISGNGTAGGTLSGNVVNTATQYKIGGNRVLSVSGGGTFLNSNTFTGFTAGAATTPDASNNGTRNSFYGQAAGSLNTTGFNNSFFGEQAGFSNTGGNNNSFFGTNAGGANNSGNDNSFFGLGAGGNSTTGISNSFFGVGAGMNNTTGSNNTFIGDSTDVIDPSFQIHDSTAIGANATVGTSHTIVLGTGAETTRIPGNLIVTGTMAGTLTGTASNATTAANATQLGGVAASQYVQTGDSRLSDARTPTAGSANYIQNRTTAQASTNFNISGTGTATDLTASGTVSGNVVKATEYDIGILPALIIANDNVFVNQSQTRFGSFNTYVGTAAGVHSSNNLNSFFGFSAGQLNTGTDNSFFGANNALNNSAGSENSFFGYQAGFTNTTGTDNTLIGANADVASGGLTHATAIGAGATVSTSNTIVLGSGETTLVSGNLIVTTLGSAGATTLCRNASNQISTCSSSLRYKTNIGFYGHGLDFVNRLRPITFDWKQGGMHDVGFGAEDVARIDPLLVTYNDKGQVEGVKYDRLSVVLTNAIKQQQTQIETLQATNAELNARLQAVEKLLLKKPASSRRHRR